MRNSFFLGNQTFEMRETAIPQPKHGEVLVKNMAAGICGTDVHIYNGEPGASEVNPPVVLGHEVAGEVAAVGEGVTTVKVGDHVALDPNVYCGICPACKMGKKQNCENLFAYGVNTNGGFAEYCLVPETQCFLLNPELPFEAGAMMEPLACALHGIDRIGIIPGQTVVIVGGGAIGMLMLQLSKFSGASCVLLSEPIEMRRNIALELGADGVIDPINEDIKERIKALSGRNGADVVIECVGNVRAVEQAFQMAGFGATVMLFSVPKPNTTAALPLYDVFKKELKIMGSIINPGTNQRAVELLNRGKVKTEKIITHFYSLENVEKAILAQMGTDSIKVMVHPQE